MANDGWSKYIDKDRKAKTREKSRDTVKNYDTKLYAPEFGVFIYRLRSKRIVNGFQCKEVPTKD